MYVIDNQTKVYIVEANSAEEAKSAVEQSSDADAEFGYHMADSEWFVDSVVGQENQ